MRDSAFGPPAISPDFWSRPEVTAALDRRDIGKLFRLLNALAGMSQTRIGAATGNAQGRVSQIIHGNYEVRTVKSLDRIAEGLGMPDDARVILGLAPSSPAPAAGPPALAALPAPSPAGGALYPATTDEAVTASTGLWQADASRTPELISAPLEPAAWTSAALAWLVSDTDAHAPVAGLGRAVGRSDVTRVRDNSALFAELDNRFGGAHARRSLVHYLQREVTGLLRGRYTDDVGRELFAAVAEASLLAAWASYDCGLHGLGQRYFVQALRLAQSAADRRLACSVLSAMSHQAAFLGYLTEAASLARAARTGLHDQATPALTSQFLAMEARALARAGDTSGCHAALAAAECSFQPFEPGRDPDFISYFTEAELAAEIAHCFRDLGDARRASHHAALATPSDGQYARSDFFAMMVLADAIADQDDPDQACHAALDALRLGESLTSARCVSYVREFRRRLDRFSGHPAVRDFREQATSYALWAKATA
jgi:transcriptional regulator with XRE-family HTH domain